MYDVKNNSIIAVHLHPDQSKENHRELLDLRLVLQFTLASADYHQTGLCQGLWSGEVQIVCLIGDISK